VFLGISGINLDFASLRRETALSVLLSGKRYSMAGAGFVGVGPFRGGAATPAEPLGLTGVAGVTPVSAAAEANLNKPAGPSSTSVVRAAERQLPQLIMGLEWLVFW
jgi:hypothetical protein